MRRIVLATVAFSAAVVALPAAPETWTEVKSAHFTAWSSSGDRPARDLLWQFEQIRFAVATIWPWAQVDVAKPLLVFAVKDEQGMKALAPVFWERKGSTRPASVWVTGPDRHYMAIRSDVQGDDNLYLNPYITSFFSYVGLILDVSFDRDLPIWFSRGLSGVLSNTVLRGNEIYIGAPIPWHIDKLRSEPRWRLSRLLAVTRESREHTSDEGLRQIDAESWAFLHFLMFGDNGAYRAKVNRFAARLSQGATADTAFAEAFGRVEDVERAYFSYAQRALFSFQKLVVDKGIKREQFTSRPVPPAESAAARAGFHVAMGRPAEARALIAQARAADPRAGNADIAEGLLLEREGQGDEARAKYVAGTQSGATNAYGYYRAAMLSWEGRPDEATLTRIESNLARAVELNPQFAAGVAGLAEVRAALKQPVAAVVPLLAKAVKLDPSDPWIRISAARALWRINELAQARNVAQIALNLSRDDGRARAEAQRLLSTIPEKR